MIQIKNKNEPRAEGLRWKYVDDDISFGFRWNLGISLRYIVPLKKQVNHD